MREEYDFSKGIKNPYTKKGKKQISINIAESSIDYFKEESQETGIPYQVLIDLYLADCVKSGRKLELAWEYWFFRVKKLDTVCDKWYSLSEMEFFL